MIPTKYIPTPQQAEKVKTDAIGSIKTVAIYGAVGLGLYFGGRFIYRRYKQGQLEAAMQTNENARYAVGIDNALHSGVFGYSVDQQALFNIASRIKNFDEVGSFYNMLTGDVLTVVLSSKLSTEEYAKFMALMQTGGTSPGNTNVSSTPTATAGLLAVSTSLVAIRKQPVIYSSGILDELSNKIVELPMNTVIGNATGQEFFFNAPWYDFFTSDVWFSELLVKASDGTRHKVYAWKGALKFVSPTVWTQQNGYNPYIFDVDKLSGINNLHGVSI